MRCGDCWHVPIWLHRNRGRTCLQTQSACMGLNITARLTSTAGACASCSAGAHALEDRVRFDGGIPAQATGAEVSGTCHFVVLAGRDSVSTSCAACTKNVPHNNPSHSGLQGRALGCVHQRTR